MKRRELLNDSPALDGSCALEGYSFPMVPSIINLTTNGDRVMRRRRPGMGMEWLTF